MRWRLVAHPRLFIRRGGLLLLLASRLASPPMSFAVQKTPSAPPDNNLRQADLLMEQGKNDQALSLLNQIVRTAPKTPGLEAKLGKAYYQKGDFQGAVAHLEAALRGKPDDGESTQLLGIAYYQLGHIEQAIPLLEKVQESMRRPDVNGSYLLGVCYLQTRQYDKARAAFARMFSVAPGSAQAHLVLGQFLLRQEFEEQAVGELREALALDPHIAMAHFLLGEIYLYKSKVEPALDEFHKELAISPVLWLVYWRMGDAYARIEKWDEAEQALKQAIWLDQNFSGSFILLGKVELKKGEPLLAAGFLERALKMDPNNFSAHYLLGSAYKKLGRLAEANREFDRSRSLHPDEKP